MNISRMILLAAAVMLAGSVHAQGCSGGADGGMDATGNQCSDPGGADSYTSTRAPRNVQTPVSTSVDAPAPRSTSGPVRSAVVATASSGHPRYAKKALAVSTKDATPNVAPCIDGVRGGMNPDGNRCATSSRVIAARPAMRATALEALAK